MKFRKTENIYQIIRVTGNEHHILGIRFDENPNEKNTIQIIDLDFPKIDNTKVRTSHTELLDQVLDGLDSLNRSLQTTYMLSKIYYVPSLDGSSSIYRTLIRALIRRYHNSNKFEEF